MRIPGLLALAVLVLLPLGEGPADARRFRDFQAISRPEAAPRGFTTVEQPLRLPRALVEATVRDVFAAWSDGRLREKLSDRFADAERLIQQIAISAPQDARIRLLGLQSINELGQFRGDATTGTDLVLSRVAVVARTALEFDDPTNGFQRLEGTHEYIFTITARVKR